ncbi:SOS response-associated peptidase [Allosphingosinicella indica]|uniref:Abasic site processing protein n=1 Tax=Allosphingosinicella indica TaxID=941907 RepID=A0A1X7FYF8_9SPHN|nr:SOS response-associated peptidase family protein [Allosphingosinicella indica]SMF61068.1 Putative SOS response-associated peptidase YedK [Allosphingosinicella indica]
MCNLYTVRKSAAEIALHFGVPDPVASNAGPDVYPGQPGLVVRGEGDSRRLQSMIWGFPLRLKTMKPGSQPKPVNNIADLNKAMWIGFARKPQWRCIIPVTEFAEAEGVKGSKTRTWFSVQDEPLFGWAGLWRDSAEWGSVYSGVMTDCNDAIRPVHDRMPVLLRRDEYDAWLRGSFQDVLAFQARCFPAESIIMRRTSDPWVTRRATA